MKSKKTIIALDKKFWNTNKIRNLVGELYPNISEKNINKINRNQLLKKINKYAGKKK